MQSLPQLGKLTRHGYRRAKGYVDQNGKRVQKTFWLGRNPSTAIEKIKVIERHAERSELLDGQLIWSDAQIVAIEKAFDEIEGRSQ